MRTMWRRSAGVESLLGVRPYCSEQLWRIMSPDWLQGVEYTSVSSGISWSVTETAVSNQRTDRESTFPKINTDVPGISKSNSGYSLSSLFKGEKGHTTEDQ